MYKTKNVYDFSGGFNDTMHSLNLNDNACPEFYNLTPLPGGGFCVRNGCRQMNQLAFPGEISQIIEWKLRNGATKTIVVSNRRLYEYSSVLDEWKVVRFQNAELELKRDTVAYTFFRDFLYFSDGDKMYRWNDEVFYLSNLDEYEHHFRAGDIIKLTVSKQESLFRGESGTIMDIRNRMREKIQYARKAYVDSNLRPYRYVTESVYKVKYKFVNVPAGDMDKSDPDNLPGAIYGLKFTNMESSNYEYPPTEGHFTDLQMEEKPFYGNFSYDPDDKLNDGSSREIRLMKTTGSHWAVTYNLKADVQFEPIGYVGDYYRFISDAVNFYPHNFNYISNYAYLGDAPIIEKISAEDIEPNITEILDVPKEVIACSYFCFYGKRQRFMASGNPEDPTAVYVSKLGTFEAWDDAITVYPDYNLGAVTGLKNMNEDVLICLEQGFCYLDSELLLADGSETVVEYIPRVSSVPIGCSDGNTLCSCTDGIVFYHNENIYLASFSLFGKNYVKMPSQNELICLSKDKCENILKGSTKHRAIYHNHKYYLSFLDKDTQDKMLIYDFKEHHFLLYGDVPVSAMVSKENRNQLVIASGKYLLSAYEEGIYSDTVSGSVQPIHFSLRSKYFDLGYDFRRTSLVRLYLVMNCYQMEESVPVDAEAEESDIVFSLLGDCQTRDIVNHLNDGVLWKNAKWGDRYAWNNEFVIHSFNLNFNTNKIGFTISNTADTQLNGPLVFYNIAMSYTKLGEDVTKKQDELTNMTIPDFQHWPDERG